MIRGGNATAYVSSLQRSIDFYVETLGFKLTSRGDGSAEVDAGDGLVLVLRVAAAGDPAPGAAGSIAIGLIVDQPIDDVVQVLSNRGVAFHGSFFADPDGNVLFLRR